MDLCLTASLINSLDVIVSVDTMVAHLAGALGKKVYLLLHTESDWRWLQGREDSPWYPTMSLLRQTRAGDWKPVVSQLVDILMRITSS
jgi:ADP-heptose:LPS heptosyltransferase